MHLLIKIVSIAIFLIGIINFSAFAADEETLAQQAEQSSKYREALTFYVNALQSVSEGSSKDLELRERIIKLVQKIQPPPVVPEEAERYMARARAAVKAAKNEQGFLRAANEFKQALKTAPWLADGYYNLGVVLDKGGKYPDAMQNLRLYLLASPNATDVKEVKQLIYEIEYRQEEAKRVKIEPLKAHQIAGYYSVTWPWSNETEKVQIGARENKILLYKLIGGTYSDGTPRVELELQGFALEGTLKHYLIGLRGDPFKCSGHSPATEVPITGLVSEDKKTITLRFQQPFIDGKNCGIYYEEKVVVFTRTP
jgi:tetratricopeptide (TPR) repeat protein